MAQICALSNAINYNVHNFYLHTRHFEIVDAFSRCLSWRKSRDCHPTVTLMWSCICLLEDVESLDTLTDSKLMCTRDCSVTADMDVSISELQNREQDNSNSGTLMVRDDLKKWIDADKPDIDIDKQNSSNSLTDKSTDSGTYLNTEIQTNSEHNYNLL